MTYGISFDFWNTLYGNGDETQRQNLRCKYFHKILSTYADISKDAVENLLISSSKMFINEWTNNYRTPNVPERILYMCKQAGVELSTKDLTRAADYFGSVINLVPPLRIPFINRLIPVLAGRFPLAIISDTGYIRGNRIREFLKNELLLSFFKSHVFSDEHAYCKPHPFVFDLTCQQLNIPRNQLIHIGDLEHTDVQGIKNIGGISIKFTGLNRTAAIDSQADYVIHDYKELPGILHDITGYTITI